MCLTWLGSLLAPASHPKDFIRFLRLAWFSIIGYKIEVLKYAPIAQLVEQLPFKETVPGSSPGGRTKYTNIPPARDFVI